MRAIGLLMVMMAVSLYARAQQEGAAEKKSNADSIGAIRTEQAALMYPRLRQFSISHQENAIGTINSKLYGQDYFKGRFRSSRTTINMNVPLIDQPKNILVGSLGVIHQFFYLSDIESYNTQKTFTTTETYIPMINIGLSYTRRDSLFGKPVSFTVGVNGLFDPPMERRQITFMGLATFPLIQKRYTSLIAGIVISSDPSSPSPFIPFLSYYHKFKDADLDLMIDLPYRFALRKPVKKASFTLLTEMAGSNSFFKFEDPNPTLPLKMTYSLLELKSGILVEYRFTRKLVFGLSGGITSTLKSRILEQGAGPNDYFIDNKIKTVPYAQASLSLLPFWRPFNKH